LVRAGLGKRVMFGSDQMRWPEKIGEAIEAIEQAPFLTQEQKRDILYHNAVRFLRLEQDAAKGGIAVGALKCATRSGSEIMLPHATVDGFRSRVLGGVLKARPYLRFR